MERTSSRLCRVAALHKPGRSVAGHDIDGRDRQENLLANHLAKTDRSAANAHVGNFSERILLDIGEFTYRHTH